jgi:hypothetical protein
MAEVARDHQEVVLDQGEQLLDFALDAPPFPQVQVGQVYEAQAIRACGQRFKMDFDMSDNDLCHHFSPSTPTHA